MSKIWRIDQFIVVSLYFYIEKRKSYESISFQHLNLRLLVLQRFTEALKEKWICLREQLVVCELSSNVCKKRPFLKFCHKVEHFNPPGLNWRMLRVSWVKKIPNRLCVQYYLLKSHRKMFSFTIIEITQFWNKLDPGTFHGLYRVLLTI